ncbi:hypothetical protein PTKIN_Ptkin15bG0135100 [Pterospermum kingtungense]
MGKYMKKCKIAGDVVAVMEVSHQSTIGARTRDAKTLALKRLQKTNPSRSPHQLVDSTPDEVSSFSYLQLRSRRLQKLPPTVSNQSKQKNGDKKSKGCLGKIRETKASFGENNLGFELRDRSTRESTPCSLMKDSETMPTPGSTTKQRSSPSSHRRQWNDVQSFTPTTHEMEELFACAERQQQREFIEKYNFDIVNDFPLPGRYEWVQVIP